MVNNLASNIFFLIRTIKQEHVYLNPTDSVVELRQGIGDFIEFYNHRRPHQSIEAVFSA